MRKSMEPLLAVTLLFSAAVCQAASSNQTFNIQQSQWVSCANGGQGEQVDLAGTLNISVIYNLSKGAQSWSAQGIEQFRYNLIGRGETTGTRYTGTGFLNLNFKLYPPEGEVAKQAQNFVVHGGATTLVVHY